MANYLASIFGTEQDKVRWRRDQRVFEALLTFKPPGQLLVLLQDWRMQTRRSLLEKTCKALVLADDPAAEPISEPSVPGEQQDECLPDAESLRCLL